MERRGWQGGVDRRGRGGGSGVQGNGSSGRVRGGNKGRVLGCYRVLGWVVTAVYFKGDE